MAFPMLYTTVAEYTEKRFSKEYRKTNVKGQYHKEPLKVNALNRAGAEARKKREWQSRDWF